LLITYRLSLITCGLTQGPPEKGPETFSSPRYGTSKVKCVVVTPGFLVRRGKRPLTRGLAGRMMKTVDTISIEWKHRLGDHYSTDDWALTIEIGVRIKGLLPHKLPHLASGHLISRSRCLKRRSQDGSVGFALFCCALWSALCRPARENVIILKEGENKMKKTAGVLATIMVIALGPLLFGNSSGRW